jgi:hypothetical protein
VETLNSSIVKMFHPQQTSLDSAIRLIKLIDSFGLILPSWEV